MSINTTLWSLVIAVYFYFASSFAQTLTVPVTVPVATNPPTQQQEETSSFLLTAENIQKILNMKVSLYRVGNSTVEMSSLKKMYEVRGYQPIWIENGKLNSLGVTFVEMLSKANLVGLNKLNYLDKYVLKMLNSISNNQFSQLAEESSQVDLNAKFDQNQFLFWSELILSDRLINFSKHLNAGRVNDLEVIDDDIRYIKKPFNKYGVLNSIIQSGAAKFQENYYLKIEPQNRLYKSIKSALVSIYALVNKYDLSVYETKIIDVKGKSLKLGSKDEAVLELKKRMSLFGFKFSEIEMTDEYNIDFKNKISEFNKTFKISESGINQSLLKILNQPIINRIRQLEVSLEKSRWLPDQLESNHIFVNLAFQELKVFEAENLVLQMKTINGQKFRRTPSMKDQVTVVELNPTWTVPFNIAIKDKLPKLKENPGYLTDHNMTLIDNATQEILDPSMVDWSLIEKEDFKYTIVQGSGRDNALGLVKFPLTNPFSIYMHDTNERNLFAKDYRLLSSGCIRLEKPFDFANYVLKDQPEYNDERIRELVNEGIEKGNESVPTRIKLSKSIPVYTLFLTVDVSDEGVVRFNDDIYGSDLRLIGILDSTNKQSVAQLLKAAETEEIPELNGMISFIGTPGKVQYSKTVKIYKCTLNKRNSCEYYADLELNKKYILPIGDYMALFDNTWSENIVSIKDKETQEISLINIKLPDSWLNESDLKFYKDFSFRNEQNKIYNEMFYFKTPVALYKSYDFGDFYTSAPTAVNMNSRIDYQACYDYKTQNLSEEAATVCSIYKSAKKPMQLRNLFSFKSLSSFERFQSGGFSQTWVTRPGDRTKIQHKKHLVSAPTTGSDSVLVFPGMYRVLNEKNQKTITIKAEKVISTTP